jgi:DNA-binding protein HU-beta
VVTVHFPRAAAATPDCPQRFNELVTRQLKKEGSLRLAGLGVFRKRKTKARMGRNPATGEQIKIPARTRLRFTPAKALKDSVLGAR